VNIRVGRYVNVRVGLYVNVSVGRYVNVRAGRYVNVRVGHKMHDDINISVAHTRRDLVKLMYPKNWKV
jgi:hypothetical protein